MSLSSLLRAAPASALLCAAARAMSAPVSAGTLVNRSFAQTGTGACQPALPVYAGVIRARPLAIQNEATTSAYLNCALVGTHLGPTGGQEMTDVYVGVINNTAADVAVTCSTIDGIAKVTTPFVSSKTVTVGAGTSAELHWNAADNNGHNYLFNANMQCLLPPGIGVSYLVSFYQEDIGA